MSLLRDMTLFLSPGLQFYFDSYYNAAVSPDMPLTLEQILAHEQRLKQEIDEKQSLVEVCQLARSKLTEGAEPPAARPEEIALDPSKISNASISAAATPPPPPAFYVHPELAAIYERRGNYGDVVEWAIKQMTDDYSVADIAARLQREGANLSGAQISVVLGRLKRNGAIEEIRQGRGRGGSIFRKPSDAVPPEETSTDQPGGPSRTGITGDETAST
jgi:hypothetical protein